MVRVVGLNNWGDSPPLLGSQHRMDVCVYIHLIRVFVSDDPF